MAVTLEKHNTFWMSRLKETAYGTRRTNSDNFVRIQTSDLAPWDEGVTTDNDGSQATGSDRPENVWNTEWSTQKGFPHDFNFTEIGRHLYAALGSVSVSGTSPTFTHTITPQAATTSLQLPSYTFGQKLGGLWIDIFTSGISSSLAITGGTSGKLQVNPTYYGNGFREQDPSSYTQPSLTSGLEYGFAQQCSIAVTDGGSLNQTLTCHLENWSWNFNNNLKIKIRPCSSERTTGNPEGGYILSECLMGERDYKFSATYRLTSSSDPMRGALVAGTSLSITHTITSTRNIPTSSPSTPYSLSIAHTKARLTEAKLTTVDGYDAISFTADLLSSSGSIPLTATLVNNTTSYLT